MLLSLSIKNYAIINDLQVSFGNGFSVITGETGAGKSIIMGALGLILGQRAEQSTFRNKDAKCVVEGRFQCSITPEITSFFETNDLDLDMPVIMRREVSSSGKSRAFINDTPVNVALLRDLGIQLIDIHSQHANLELGKRTFQLKVVDLYGSLASQLAEYQGVYQNLRTLEADYKKIKDKESEEKSNYDYNMFQFKQLSEAKLVSGEQESLEQEQEVLSHTSEITEGLCGIKDLLNGEDLSVISKTKESLSILAKLRDYLPQAEQLHSRIESVFLELRDIADECSSIEERTEFDPDRLSFVQSRLDTIFSLQQKHRVASVNELIDLQNALDRKLQEVASYDEHLEKLEKQINKVRTKAKDLAQSLHEARQKQIPDIEKDIHQMLSGLGMPSATFSIDLQTCEKLSSTGFDEAIFLFCANKGGVPEEISKVASGGEMSRLMLSIKMEVAKSKALPAIIFDEIDTGISGEVAVKMGEMLSSMSQYMQVINITHLPQIAAKGENHYFVFKTETENGTETSMRQLTRDERIIEISKMLSGENPSNAAIENAKSLLG